jgi:hypothetical protein
MSYKPLSPASACFSTYQRYFPGDLVISVFNHYLHLNHVGIVISFSDDECGTYFISINGMIREYHAMYLRHSHE